MKVFYLKVIIITMIIILLMSFSNISTYNMVFASGAFDIDPFETGDAGTAAVKTKEALGTVLAVTKTITAGIAIIMLTILAIKYMMAAPNDRAEIKKHAMVYVIGAVVMFGASGILSIIESFSGNFSA